jgi:hypothetical protein
MIVLRRLLATKSRLAECLGLGDIQMLPRSGGKALLFDIDGTLADTDALHLEAFNQVFGPRAMCSITRASRKSSGFFHRVNQ